MLLHALEVFWYNSIKPLWKHSILPSKLLVLRARWYTMWQKWSLRTHYGKYPRIVLLVYPYLFFAATPPPSSPGRWLPWLDITVDKQTPFRCQNKRDATKTVTKLYSTDVALTKWRSPWTNWTGIALIDEDINRWSQCFQTSGLVHGYASPGTLLLSWHVRITDLFFLSETTYALRTYYGSYSYLLQTYFMWNRTHCGPTVWLPC